MINYDWFIFQHAMCDENSVDWTAHLRPPLLQGFGIWWRVSGVSAELSTNGSVWNSPPNHFHIKNDYFDLFWSILICIYIYIEPIFRHTCSPCWPSPTHLLKAAPYGPEFQAPETLHPSWCPGWMPWNWALSKLGLGKYMQKMMQSYGSVSKPIVPL